jgi:hypothetical protein
MLFGLDYGYGGQERNENGIIKYYLVEVSEFLVDDYKEA